MKSKILVFAHTPPPLHGQSYMVELMLQGLGGDCRLRSGQKKTDLQAGDAPSVQCFHVNARVSDDLEDVGGMRLGKLVRLAKFCLEAIGCRLRYRVDTLYYVPAPAKRSAILRDWVVMLLVRPWFRRTIFHWHASGLGYWVLGVQEATLQGLELAPPFRLFGKAERLAKWLTRTLLKNADLSIVLSEYQSKDAAFFHPQRQAILPNSIEDNVRFEADVLLRREVRRKELRRLFLADGDFVGEGYMDSVKQDVAGEGSQKNFTYKLLHLAHCSREKGLFELLPAIRLANERLRKMNRPILIALTVAGSFPSDDERIEFDQLLKNPELASCVQYAGFLNSPEKKQAFDSHDALCSFSHRETFGLNVLEAIQAGLPVITSPLEVYQQTFGDAIIVADQATPPSYAAAILNSLIAEQAAAGNKEKCRALFDVPGYLEKMATLLASG